MAKGGGTPTMGDRLEHLGKKFTPIGLSDIGGNTKSIKDRISGFVGFPRYKTYGGAGHRPTQDERDAQKREAQQAAQDLMQDRRH